MTLVEVMLALAIAAAFLSGVFAAFIQILDVTDEAQARMEAVNNGRAALEVMAIDIKAASLDTTHGEHEFLGVNRRLPYGDGIDNDGDGLIDEESPNALDDDGDWTLADDNHAIIGTTAERWYTIGEADLGDFHVDEDCLFDNDSLQFRIFPDPLSSSGRNERISYEIGSYDGEANVLIRRTASFLSGGVQAEEVSSPLAFNVLSLNFLYMDPNSVPPQWVEVWDAGNADEFPEPGIEIPVTVAITVTVYAGTDPLEQFSPGDPIPTISLSTMVNIEQILNDPRLQDLYAGISSENVLTTTWTQP